LNTGHSYEQRHPTAFKYAYLTELRIRVTRFRSRYTAFPCPHCQGVDVPPHLSSSNADMMPQRHIMQALHSERDTGHGITYHASNNTIQLTKHLGLGLSLIGPGAKMCAQVSYDPSIFNVSVGIAQPIKGCQGLPSMSRFMIWDMVKCCQRWI